MDSSTLVNEILQNIADYKDLHGGTIFGEGRKRRRKRRVGRGLITGELSGMDQGQGIYGLEGKGVYGLEGYGLVGGAKRKRKAAPKRRKSSFNIGKYSKAVANGATKEEAKKIARGGSVNALY